MFHFNPDSIKIDFFKSKQTVFTKPTNEISQFLISTKFVIFLGGHHNLYMINSRSGKFANSGLPKVIDKSKYANNHRAQLIKEHLYLVQRDRVCQFDITSGNVQLKSTVKVREPRSLFATGRVGLVEDYLYLRVRAGPRVSQEFSRNREFLNTTQVSSLSDQQPDLRIELDCSHRKKAILRSQHYDAALHTLFVLFDIKNLIKNRTPHEIRLRLTISHVDTRIESSILLVKRISRKQNRKWGKHSSTLLIEFNTETKQVRYEIFKSRFYFQILSVDKGLFGFLFTIDSKYSDFVRKYAGIVRANFPLGETKKQRGFFFGMINKKMGLRPLPDELTIDILKVPLFPSESPCSGLISSL